MKTLQKVALKQEAHKESTFAVWLTKTNINGNQGIVTLNLRHLVSGAYHLQVSSGDGTLMESHQIMLNK